MQQELKLKFEVEEVQNVRIAHRIGRKVEGSKSLTFTDVVRVVPAAWMVYFPSGHSLMVESAAEMYRLGFLETPPVVDMLTGEVVPDMENLSPKEIVKRNTQHRRMA